MVAVMTPALCVALPLVALLLLLLLPSLGLSRPRHSLRPLASVVALVGMHFAFFLLLLAALRPSARLRQRERPAAADADADVTPAARPSAAGLLSPGCHIDALAKLSSFKF